MDGAFGHRPLADAVRLARAVATNQLARVMPEVYVRVTGETGRGREVSTPAETAQYFMQCMQDYLEVLEQPIEEMTAFWSDKRVVEYGPGDIPGVALLLVGIGARSVLCVDRFPLVRFDEYQQTVIQELAGLLPDSEAQGRMWACFVDPKDLSAGLREGPIRYAITESGLVGQRDIADIVISRAVLEHVNDLSATFDDMAAVLAPDGVAVHKVDLKSHGLHRRNRLDFLTWPDCLWQWMYSEKGAPNRLRVDRYESEASRVGFRLDVIKACELASQTEIDEVRPHLAKPFRSLTDEQLAWLSFWMVARRTPQISHA
jgi:SAM-dependent methyltransferase